MNGEVLQAPTEAGAGLVLGEDGHRYALPLAEMRGIQPAAAGARVDFVPNAGTATDVYVRVGAGASAALPAAAGGSAGAPATTSTPGLSFGVASVVLATFALIMPGVGLFMTLIGLPLGVMGASQARQAGADDALLWSRVGWISNAVLMVVQALVLLVVLAFGMAFLWPFIAAIGLDDLARYSNAITR
jgi:hypothetical protein